MVNHIMKTVKVPAKYKNALVLPDLHIPKQDNHAIYLAEDYGKKNKVDCIVLLGDVMDMTPFSKFKKSPKEEDVKAHFDKAEEYIDRLRYKFPTLPIYWTEGNHDLWFDTYLYGGAKELRKDPYFSLRGRLKLDKYKVTYLPETSILKFHDYYLHHGHLFFRGKATPLIPAKAGFEAVLDNIIFGHVHKLSHWPKKGMGGKQFNAYSTACLSSLSPNYSPFANYQNGFLNIFRKGKATVVRNIAIEHKEALF